MGKQFDLEQEIMNCWHVVDDIDTVLTIVEYGDEDRTINALIGLKELYSVKFEKLFDTFEKYIKEKYAAENAEAGAKTDISFPFPEPQKSVEPFGW